MRIRPEVWRWLCRMIDPEVRAWLAKCEEIVKADIRRQYGDGAFPDFRFVLRAP